MPLMRVPTRAAQNVGCATAELAKLSVNVSYPELLRNLREIGGRPNAPCGLELGPGLVRQFKERTQRRVIDDEVHLGPVLGSLADVPGGCVLPYPGEGFLVIGRQQTLVDAQRR